MDLLACQRFTWLFSRGGHIKSQVDHGGFRQQGFYFLIKCRETLADNNQVRLKGREKFQIGINVVTDVLN